MTDLPPEIQAMAALCDTPIETAETIYAAYVERQYPLDITEDLVLTTPAKEKN